MDRLQDFFFSVGVTIILALVAFGVLVGIRDKKETPIEDKELYSKLSDIVLSQRNLPTDGVHGLSPSMALSDIDVMCIIIKLEDDFNIDILPGTERQLKTVGDIYKYLVAALEYKKYGQAGIAVFKEKRL